MIARDGPVSGRTGDDLRTLVLVGNGLGTLGGVLLTFVGLFLAPAVGVASYVAQRRAKQAELHDVSGITVMAGFCAGFLMTIFGIGGGLASVVGSRGTDTLVFPFIWLVGVVGIPIVIWRVVPYVPKDAMAVDLFSTKKEKEKSARQTEAIRKPVAKVRVEPKAEIVDIVPPDWRDGWPDSPFPSEPRVLVMSRRGGVVPLLPAVAPEHLLGQESEDEVDGEVEGEGSAESAESADDAVASTRFLPPVAKSTDFAQHLEAGPGRELADPWSDK